MSPATIGERVLLTLWVGGMWAIGFIAAPTLFSALDDRRLAGDLAGQLFTIMSYLGLVCGGLLLVGALARSGTRWVRDGRVWTLIVMLVIIVIGEFVLQPMMSELKATGLAEGSPEAARFGQLHGTASTLFLINSLLGLGLVAFGIRGSD